MKPIVSYIILLLFVVLLVAIGILISELGVRVCLTTHCDAKAKLITNSIDSEVNPCDNFYKFICGGYQKSNRKIHSVLEELEKKQLWNVVDYLSPPLTNEDDRMLLVGKELYQKCIDVKLIEKDGLVPLLNVLKMINGFPLIDGDIWTEFREFHWTIYESEFLSHAAGLSTSHFIETNVRKYLAESNKLFPFLSVPRTLKYANEIDFDNYYQYFVELYAILNGNDSLSNERMQEINETIKLKVQLVNLAKSTTNCSKETNDFEHKDFFLDFKNKNLGSVIDLISIKAGSKAVFDDVVLTHGFKDYFKNLSALTENIPKRILANYVAIENIVQMTPFLPKIMRKIYNKYLRSEEDAMNEISNNRKLLCAKLIKDCMGTALGTIYLKDYLSKLQQNYRLIAITNRIKGQLKMLLKDISWMDEKNKYETIYKLEKITFVTPLPLEVIDRLFNIKTYNLYYTHFCLDPESVLNSYLSFVAIKDYKNAMTLDTNEHWYIFNEEYDIFSTEITLNQEMNTIIVPTAFLDYPVYDKQWPRYLNYGGLGSKLAYVLIHGIDFAGVKYGLESEASNWWSNFTRIHYEKERLCFVNQYNQYIEPFVARQTNDSNCVEENIANTGGVELSFFGYKEYTKIRSFPEPRLPGLERYTTEQLFFIDFATYYCKKHDKIYTLNMTDAEIGEPSHEYKVVGSLRNFPKFSESFECKPGDPMNPTKKCTVW